MDISNEKFFVGVDSGGTKCDIIIEFESGDILQEKFPSLHYSLHGAEVFAENFNRNFKTFLHGEKIDPIKCKGICLGIAGARERKDKVALKNKLSKFLGIKNIAIETDAMIALYGAFGNNDGAILISGTGSVLYGVNDGKLIRIGGWGKMLGDQGSGYWIGKEALRKIVKEFDIFPEPENRSLLCKLITERMNLTASNIVELSFEKKFPYQDAAPIVIEAASEKDIIAREILEKASDELIDHISEFLSVSNRKKNLELAFVGSLIDTENLYSEIVKKKIKIYFGKKIVVLKNHKLPAYGGLILAKKYFN